MWHIEERFSVKLGGNTYINTPNLIVYRGEPIFRIRRSDTDGILGIDFDIRDAAGQRVATIAKGVVVQGNEQDYEITTGSNRYAVTQRATGTVICDIKRRAEAQGVELEVAVRLYMPNGFFLDAGPEQTNIGGITVRGYIFNNCDTGIAID